jgi:hypothetical protein
MDRSALAWSGTRQARSVCVIVSFRLVIVQKAYLNGPGLGNKAFGKRNRSNFFGSPT